MKNQLEQKENIKIELAVPAEKFKDSYIEAIKEFQKEGKRESFKIEELEADFAPLIRRLDEETRGINLEDWQVPQTELWLIKNNQYIGDIRIRSQLNEQLEKLGGNIGYAIRPAERMHGYGKLILELGLQRAKGFGLKEVLITADESNIGSRKIIEGNGGRLINCKKIDKRDVPICYYKIKLT